MGITENYIRLRWETILVFLLNSLNCIIQVNVDFASKRRYLNEQNSRYYILTRFNKTT